MTTTGTVSQSVASGGHAQLIANPTAWGSRTKAAIVSARYALVVPLAFGTTSYTGYLPQGALILNAQIQATSTFTSGSQIQIGSSPAVAAATGVTVTPGGTTGGTSYSYKVVAYDPSGSTFSLSTAGSTTTGNATLSPTNNNVITWTAPASGTVSSYAIYRTVGGAAQGLIGTVAAGVLTFTDTGIAAGASAPTASTSGVDILAATNLTNSNNIPVNPALVSTVLNKSGNPEAVQSFTAALVGTAATAGAGYLFVEYINTVTAPAQI